MAKDPAFLFYSKDFLIGVSDLTMEERGQYITLLCIQHQKGELTDRTIRLTVSEPSEELMKHFDKLPNGNYRNDRLYREALKRAEFCESRRKSGEKGGRPKAHDKPSGNRTHKRTKNRAGNANGNANTVSNANGNAKHLHQPMLEIYLAFMAEQDIPPKVDEADHAGLKAIRSYLLTITTEDKVADAWAHLLASHARWPEWNQTHLRIRDINSQIQNIVSHLKKSKKGKTADDKHREIWQSDLYKQ